MSQLPLRGPKKPGRALSLHVESRRRLREDTLPLSRTLRLSYVGGRGREGEVELVKPLTSSGMFQKMAVFVSKTALSRSGEQGPVDTLYTCLPLS